MSDVHPKTCFDIYVHTGVSCAKKNVYKPRCAAGIMYSRFVLFLDGGYTVNRYELTIGDAIFRSVGTKIH